MSNAPGPARGVLRHAPGPGLFHHARLAPSPALAGVVQHFWIVRWDLQGGAPQRRETLPHPNIHLVLQPGRTRIQGIVSRRFTTTLEGQGGVFGIKFRPGAFRPFLRRPVSALRDRSLPLRDVFGAAGETLEASVFAQTEDRAQVAVAEAFLSAHLPSADPQATLAGEMVDRIAADRKLASVDALLAHWPMGNAPCSVCSTTMWASAPNGSSTATVCTRRWSVCPQAAARIGRGWRLSSGTSTSRTSSAISRRWWAARRPSTPSASAEPAITCRAGAGCSIWPGTSRAFRPG